MTDLESGNAFHGTVPHPFYPGEMEMHIIKPSGTFDWHGDSDAVLSYYDQQMRQAEIEKSELLRRELSLRKDDEFTIRQKESDLRQGLRSFLLTASQDVVVEVAVKLAQKLHEHNLDKDARDELAKLLPQVEVEPPAEIATKVTPEALRAIMSAGLERFLNHIKKQIPPEGLTQYEIRFQNLNYTATVEVKESTIETIGSQLLDIVWPFTRKTKIQKKILNDLTGIVKAGQMTLVLGLPGSGKSCFLKAFSGMLHLDSDSVRTGDLVYNGQLDAGDLHIRRLTKYVEQRECHLPTMTVGETLSFARQCLTSPAPPGSDLSQIDSLQLQAVMLSLGLAHVADTPVGDENIRGVSGGERRRVTLAEMMMGQARIFCLDEISTGLDSSSTFDIMNSIKQLAHTMGSTFLISLLQPLPDTFHLFDELVLLADGHIVFQGPIPQALEHFRALGFEQPRRLDDADYLIACTSEDAVKIYRGGPLGAITPSPAELAEAWKKHPTHLAQLQALQQPSPFPPASGELGRKLFGTPFAQSFWDQTKLCFRRQVLLTKRNLPFLRARIAQALIMGLIIGSLFYKMDLNNVQIRMGFMFSSLLTMSLNHFSGIPVSIQQKAVFFKQRRQGFFGIPQFVVSAISVQVPVILLECFIFVTISYFLSGLTTTDSGTHFALNWLITVLASLSICATFTALAYAAPAAEMATTYAGLFVLVTMLFAGFMIPETDIPDYWIWAYYITPFSWGFRSLVVNEFRSPDYDAPLPTDPSRSLGVVFLESFGFKTDKGYIAYGIIMLAGQFLLYSFLAAFSLRKSTIGIPNKIITKPALQERGIPQTITTGPALKFTPATLSFHDVAYSVTKKGSDERLLLLNGVYGYMRPGTLTALMGSSGAGKTTLLDVLAGRKTSGKIEGQILVNGFPKDGSFSRMCGYCEQMDIHTQTTTVHEALLFSAQLRLEAQADQVVGFVDNVMSLLELWPIANNLVKSLSTEQSKRLTIGVELAANPSILFLDEPTSGLDARAAGIVMAAIKNVAATGRTVICTIHQPSAEIFENFDRLLLLKRGGQTVYFGPLGTHSETLIDYFERIPGTKKCFESQNPASYMLDVIGAGVGNSSSVDFVNEYKRSPLSRENDIVLEHILQNVNPAERVTFSRRFARSFQEQLYYCLMKNFKSYWRMPEYNLVRSMFLIIVAIIFGSLYFDNDATSRAGAFSRISVCYVSALFIGIVNANTLTGVAFKERAVFYREKAAGMYNVLAYSMASAVVEIPFLAFNSLCFCGIFYFMVGLKASFGSFLFFTLMFFLFTSMCTYFGLLMASAMPTHEIAGVAIPAVVSIWNLFCGYLIAKPNIPDPYVWLYWISPLHYFLEAVVTEQFHCDSVSCFTISVLQPSGEIIEVTSDGFVHDTFGMRYDDRWFDLLALVLFVALFRVLSSWALFRINHNTR